MSISKDKQYNKIIFKIDAYKIKIKIFAILAIKNIKMKVKYKV